MATTSQPSTGLLAVGHQCSAQYCNLVDFLPFKCQHCEQKFCGEHYLPAFHNCGKYDELKHNRVAPSCPLCNIPVTIPLGQDPNIRMDRHIASECSVTTGKATQSTQPHCANPRCKKLLFAPIRCDKCSQEFCVRHRFPTDHTCKTGVATQSLPKPVMTHPSANSETQEPATKVSPRSNAAMAAIKCSMISASSSVKSNPTSSSTTRPPQPSRRSSPSLTSSSLKTTPNSPPKTNGSPLSSPNRSVTITKRTPSTCTDDVSNETELSKSKPALYAPPSLFASA